jgi:hypothetical protein
MESEQAKEQRMNIREWFEYGYVNGFVTPPICMTHDEVYTSEELDRIYLEGDEICAVGLRVLQDIPWFDYGNE